MAKTPKETFFPGVRKALHVDHFVPLANPAGEKRQAIDFSLSLADGQFVGLPEWLTEGVALVQKGRSTKDVSPIQLDGVTLRVFATLDGEAEVITIPNCLLKGFVVQPTSKSPKADGTVVDVEIIFRCYLSWNPKVWEWMVRYYNGTCWVVFATTQAKISFGAPRSEAELKADADKKAAAAKQGNIFEAKPDIAPPAPVEEIAGGEASFADVGLGQPFRFDGARWFKLTDTEASKQLDPNTRVKFSKATRVSTGAGGPIPEPPETPFDSKSAAANDDTLSEDPTYASGIDDDEEEDGLDAIVEAVIDDLTDAMADVDPEDPHTFTPDASDDEYCVLCGEDAGAEVHQPAEPEEAGHDGLEDDDAGDGLVDYEGENQAAESQPAQASAPSSKGKGGRKKAPAKKKAARKVPAKRAGGEGATIH